MGKMRRKKNYKFHTRAALSLSRQPKQQDKGSITCSPQEGLVPLPADIMECSSVVSLATRSTVTTSGGRRDNGTEKSGGRGKKEKRYLKRESWRKKIELIQQNKKEQVEEERRRKTVIVGDMQPLASSLPAISSSLPDKLRPSKEDQRTLTLLSEVEQYQAVLRHPAFQKDPMSTISEHVQNAVATGTL